MEMNLCKSLYVFHFLVVDEFIIFHSEFKGSVFRTRSGLFSISSNLPKRTLRFYL